MKKYKLGIITPLALGNISVYFYKSIVAARNYLIANESKLPFQVEDIKLWEPSTFPLDANRNECVSHILENDVDMSVWIDADQVLKEDTIFQLFSKGYQYPIYAGIYYLKKEPFYPIAFKQKDKDFRQFETLFRYPDEPFYADMIGMGCVKINKEVFEKLDKPYFKYQSVPPVLGGLSDYIDGNMTDSMNMFILGFLKNTIMLDINGGLSDENLEVHDVSEDVWFWKQVKEKTDYRVVVDPNIDVGHITQMSITRTIAESAWGAYRENDQMAESWKTLTIPEAVDEQTGAGITGQGEPGENVGAFKKAMEA